MGSVVSESGIVNAGTCTIYIYRSTFLISMMTYEVGEVNGCIITLNKYRTTLSSSVICEVTIIDLG